MNDFKASEYKFGLLYASLPCLKDLFPSKKYYKHWSLFVYSMHIFLSESISKEDFKLAEKALKKFVLDTETLYNKEMCRYNVHLLLHIPYCVSLYGSLFSWSAFIYEDYNRVIRNMIFNSQAVTNQICKAYLRMQSIQDYKVFDKPNCSDQGKALFKHYTNTLKRSEVCVFQGDLRVISTAQFFELSVIEKTAIQTLLQKDVNLEASSFNRFIYNHILIHSEDFPRMFKRDNSIMQLNNNKFLSVNCLLLVKTVCDSNVYVIIGEEYDLTSEKMCTVDGFSSAKYSYLVRRTYNIVACYPY